MFCIGELNIAKRPEVRLKISQAVKGVPKTPEHCEALRQAQIKSQAERSGNAWKGDDAGYRAKHLWVEKKLGKPNFCEVCRNGKLRSRQYTWANISHEYKRDTNDWIRLCVKCHMAYDRNRLVLPLK